MSLRNKNKWLDTKGSLSFKEVQAEGGVRSGETMLDYVIVVDDAVAAVMTLETSMSSCCILGAGNALQSSFPEDADAEFYRRKVDVLQRLGLPHYIHSVERRPSTAADPHEEIGVHSERSGGSTTGAGDFNEWSRFEAESDDDAGNDSDAGVDERSRKRSRHATTSSVGDSEDEILF